MCDAIDHACGLGRDLVSGAAFDLIDAAHDINAVAADAGTNAYEILTSLGTRYRREYLSS